MPKDLEGLKALKGTKIVGGKKPLAEDPEILKALKEDALNLKSLDADVDVDEAMEEALEDVGGMIQGKVYPIGNGKTLPYPDSGEPSTDFAQCRKPVPGQDRGCRFFGTSCRLPQLAEKLGEPGGPYNVRYKNLRNGLVKACSCTDLAASYLRMPHIVLVPPSDSDPPGETWIPTVDAQYTPLPNGQQPTPGPNQPRTPIKWTGRKTRVICHPSPAMTREYQLMRRRGDFDKKMVQPGRRRARV